jgi:hypothetical protein
MAACLNPLGGNIAGWSGPRWNQLLDWCSSHNHKDPQATANQLDYLHHSLHGPYHNLGVKLRAANSVEAAKKIFRPYLGNEEGRLN